MPYETAAELTNKPDWTEPEEDIHNDLPDGHRMVSVLHDGGTLIEREVSSGDAWAEMAEFTHPNASFEWAEELAEGLAGEDAYRVVFDWSHGASGAWLLEVRVSDDD